MSKILKRPAKRTTKQLFASLEYCFCIFSFSTLLGIQATYARAGFIRYVTVLSIIAILMLANRLIRIRLKRFSSIILSLFLLAVISGSVFVSRQQGDLNLFFLFDWYRYDLSFFLLSLTFIYYPIVLSESGNQVNSIKTNIINNFVLLNSAIIPLIYIFSGSFNKYGVLLTQSQVDQGYTFYNNYLTIADVTLFASFLALVFRKDLLALFSFSISTAFLFLIGSRVSALLGLAITLVAGSSILGSQVFMLNRKIFTHSPKVSLVFLRNLSISVLLILIIYLLFSNSYLDFIFDLVNIDNIQNSRVYRTVFDSEVSEDTSLSSRIYYFECFYRNHLSDFDKFMLGGPSNMGCYQINYLHSTLSLLVDTGLLGFSVFTFIMYVSLKTVLMNFRKFPYDLFFHLLMLFSFLFLGFSSRSGPSLLLPTLVFTYSSSFLRGHLGVPTLCNERRQI
jgi:hypothetical protein